MNKIHYNLKNQNRTLLVTLILSSVWMNACILNPSKENKAEDTKQNPSENLQSQDKSTLSLLNENLDKSKSKDETLNYLKDFKKSNPDKTKLESEIKKQNHADAKKSLESSLKQLKSLRSDFTKFFSDSKNSEQKFAGLSQSDIVDLIDSIIDILIGIDVIKDDKNYIIGSKTCGTLEVNNENISEKCDEVRRIAECVRANCQAPVYTLILCSEDPSLEICKLNSRSACDVEPGICMAVTDTEQSIIDDLKKEHDFKNNPLL